MGGFGESINAKIDWTHFPGRCHKYIQSKSLGSIFAGRKNLNHCIFLGVPAFAFPRYVRTIRSMLAVKATREFGEVGTC